MILSKVQERGKDKKAALPEMKVNGILDNLLSYLEHEKPYLNPKLSNRRHTIQHKKTISINLNHHSS